MSPGKLHRLRELYQIGGIPEVARGVRDFAYDHTPLPVSEQYHERRTDNEQRWSFMEPYVSEYNSLVDIGCAEGFFTINAAKKGLLAVGIDSDKERLSNAFYNGNGIERCGFVYWQITSNDIKLLPETDVILLLTVHHHWERQYDIDIAEEMFSNLLSKCKLMVYEPPGDRPLVKNLSGLLDPNNSIEFYQDRLKALYGDDISILDATLVDYRDRGAANRLDPVFIIDAREYATST